MNDQDAELLQKISTETGVTIPSDEKYLTAAYECWKCKKEILVFKWATSYIEGEIPPPPEPSPSSIEYRATALSGDSYWANTCPYCHNVQGDFFLNHEPDGPFFNL